ncbi:MAG: IS200/IS605 family transposase [Bacteroidales bacterium]|jgi:putative transposase|nr:IS200/IS605 family transposase [Bacteroidales bacterium]
MSFVRIWVHLVFSTKKRIPFLINDVREKVCLHILQNCKKKNIFLKGINGYNDHLHCLISLGREQSIAQVSHLIKGESSYWINKNNIIQNNFMWQDDYFAVSISESHVPNVIKYIKNQENHHSKKTFSEETEEFINKYGFQLIKDDFG